MKQFEEIFFEIMAVEMNEGVPLTEEQKNEIRQDPMHRMILAAATKYAQQFIS